MGFETSKGYVKDQSAELLKPQARPVNAHSVEAPMNGSQMYMRSLSCGNSEVHGAVLNDKTHSLARKGLLTRVILLLSGMVCMPQGVSTSVLSAIQKVLHP